MSAHLDGVPGGLRAAAAGRQSQSSVGGSVTFLGSQGGSQPPSVNVSTHLTPQSAPLAPGRAGGVHLVSNAHLNTADDGNGAARASSNDGIAAGGLGEMKNGAPGTSSALAMALDDDVAGRAGGDLMTRVWQPSPAPEDSAVSAVMLGPPTPPQPTGGALSVQTATSSGGPERHARLAEDDGLVVRRRPHARADNTARRKQRALAEPNPRLYIDPEDGGLMCQADPVPQGGERTRPARWFDPEAPYLRTVPATSDATSDDAVVGAGGDDARRTFRLEVHVSRAEFSCHPLMGHEDRLAAQLEEAFRAYKRRESSGLVALYEAKSAAAAARAAALRQEMAAGAALWVGGVPPRERLGALEDEAEEARALARDETERLRGAVRHMIDLYGAIERARTLSGARSTSIRLTVRPRGAQAAGHPGGHPGSHLEPAAEAEAEREARAELEAEIGRRLRRAENQKLAHEAKAAELASRLAMLRGAAGYVAGEVDERRLVEAHATESDAAARCAAAVAGGVANAMMNGIITEADAQAALHAARAAAAQRRGGEAAPPAAAAQNVDELEPVLSVGASRDEGARVPRAEATRRGRAASARFAVALEVNGRLVPGQSTPVHFNAGGVFFLDVSHAFSLTVVRWPESIRLHLYEKGTVVDTHLASVPVAVPGSAPGEPLADAAPRQYQFSADSPFTPNWAVASPGAGGVNVNGRTASTQAYTSGSLFVTCRWVPQGANDGHGFGGGGFDSHAPDRLGVDVERQQPGIDTLAPPPPPSQAAKRAAAAAKVGFAAAAGGFGGFRGGGSASATGAGAPPPSGDQEDAPRTRTGAFLRASLDPLNPEDAALLETLATREALRSAGGGGFRLNAVDETVLGHGAGATKRQQLLKLRAEQGTAVTDGEGVPLSEKDIPDHLLDRNAEEEEEDLLLSAQLQGLAEADSRATRIADFLQRVRLNVAKGRRRAKAGAKAGQGPMHTDDVVKETALPVASFDMAALFECFQPRRKLRPVRRRAAAAESHPDRCEVVVNIQKAFNLPERGGGMGGGGGTSMGGGPPRGGGASRGMGGGYGRSGYGPDDYDGGGGVGPGGVGGTLAPFVEVAFQGTIVRTRVASGSSPSWQESLVLPFRPPGGDFSPAAIQTSSDVVNIVLFDEVVDTVGGAVGFGARRSSTGGRDSVGGAGESITTRHYLGSIDIPVAALYRADGAKLEGVLPLEQPPVLLGYHPPAGAAMGGGMQQRAPGGFSAGQALRPSLSVYIQFNPTLAKPDPPLSDPGMGEDEALLRHAHRWEAGVRAVGRHCKQRPYRVAATDVHGRSVLLPRYVAPTALPPGFRDAAADEPTLRQLLRFVHLVPHVTDMAAFRIPAGVDIWTTSQEFLDMCAGDSEEHALLLCGFLLTLGVEAYVVLGVSASDADAAMVFTPGGQGRGGRARGGVAGAPTYAPMLEEPLVWDPVAGTVFSVHDSACSACMGQISVVFNADNIWANIQTLARPHEMHWALNDVNHWRPFFSPMSFPQRALPTVQTVVTYQSFEAAFYERLAAAVEREAMDAIVKVRRRQHTPFNRRCSRALRELLRDLEGHVLVSPDEAAGGISLGGGRGRVSSLTELHMSNLGGVLDGYTVTGCPLNMPFTDAAAVREAVIKTCIAETNRTDVEFAVATHVEPYGATFVCSVWVYVARLTKKGY